MQKWMCERCDDPCVTFGDTEPPECPWNYPDNEFTWFPADGEPCTHPEKEIE